MTTTAEASKAGRFFNKLFNTLLHPIDYVIGLIEPDTSAAENQDYKRVVERTCNGVYVADHGLIFLLPFNTNRVNIDPWHFINVSTGLMHAYRPVSVTDSTRRHTNLAIYAFSDAVYSPLMLRIYLIPFNQVRVVEWYFIDVLTRRLDAFAGPSVGADQAYSGGVLCPDNKRIYLVPFNQARFSTWHYIDTRFSRVHAYNVSSTTVKEMAAQGAYQGGVYCPVRRRVYFVPYMQATKSHWHYVECHTGRVVAYEHGLYSSVHAAYHGGVYSPTLKRIYLVPYAQAPYAQWHYIDCESGRVVAYANEFTFEFTLSGSFAAMHGYRNGVYAPESDRIYLTPYGQASRAEWHYIDCRTGRVVAYQHGLESVKTSYEQAIYAPEVRKIFMLPVEASRHNLLQLDCETGNVSRSLAHAGAFAHQLTSKKYQILSIA